MDLTFLARGFAIGLTVASAVGPISVLTVRRTIAHGRRYGLASGLGVALADASYGAVAAFGLTAVTSVLVGVRVPLALAGGVFFVLLGLRTIRARPTGTAGAADPADRPGIASAVVSIYGLTMTNPMTILSFALVFAGIGLAGHNGPDAALVTIGVFLGSSLWWIGLTTVVGHLRSRLTADGLAWINRVAGAVLIVFGVTSVGVAVGVF